MTDDTSLLLLWSDSVLLSVLIWALLSILTLYLARRPAHELLERLGLTLSGVPRFTALLLLGYARKAAARQRSALQALASELARRRLERQLQRIGPQIEHYLGEYPKLHRALCEQVERISNDYRHAGDTPPTPPAWLEAIEAVASIKASSNPAVAAILKDMQTTLEAACHEAMLEYRADSRRRFQSLRRVQPYFGRLSDTLTQMQQRLEQVIRHARDVDAQMERFEDASSQRREPMRRLRFDLHLRALAGVALAAIATLAGFLNHSLLAQPLQAVLGDGSGPQPWVATATLSLVALNLGVWITECLGVTQMIGVSWQFHARQRRRLAAIGLSALVMLALLQGVLAWLGHSAVAFPLLPGPWWLAPLAAALLATLLTFVIAMAALPLEMLVHSLPILLAGLVAGTAHLLAALLRLCAAVIAMLPQPLKTLYDLWIFLPLWLEQAVQGIRHRSQEAGQTASTEASEGSSS